MINASGIFTFYSTAACIDVFTLLTFQVHIGSRNWPAGSTRIREIREFAVNLIYHLIYGSELRASRYKKFKKWKFACTGKAERNEIHSASKYI
jgi:hypothetical protein